MVREFDNLNNFKKNECVKKQIRSIKPRKYSWEIPCKIYVEIGRRDMPLITLLLKLILYAIYIQLSKRLVDAQEHNLWAFGSSFLWE